MKETIKSELITFLSKKYVWIITLIILIPSLWFLGTSYRNLHTKLAEKIVFVEEAKRAVEEMGIEYDFSVDHEDMLDIVSVLCPGNGINNIMLLLIGIGLILLPILYAMFIGNEYGDNQIELKSVHYKLHKVIFSKMIILVVYTMLIMVILAVAGNFIADYYWEINHDTIKLAKGYIDIPNAGLNYKAIGLTLFVLVFYSLISFLIAFLAKSGIVGIVANVLITYGEGYITNGSMPKWLFYKLLNDNVVIYDNSFAKFSVLEQIPTFGTTFSLCLLTFYLVCIIFAIVALCGRKR